MRYRRLKSKKEFARILKAGKRAYSETVTMIYLPDTELKMAVCVGKKYGKSVQRNRVKRLLREAFARYAGRLSPCAVLLLPKVRETYAFGEFERDIGKICKREQLFEDRIEKDLP